MESCRTKDHLTAGGDALQRHRYTLSNPLEVYHSLQSSHQSWLKFLTHAHCKIMTWNPSSAASAHLCHMQIISFFNIYMCLGVWPTKSISLDLVGQTYTWGFTSCLTCFYLHLSKPFKKHSSWTALVEAAVSLPVYFPPRGPHPTVWELFLCRFNAIYSQSV